VQLERTLGNPYAHDYQLLIKNILNAPIYYDPNQEIVYRGEKRFTYATFKKRVHQLANMLTSMGVKAGDTVAVMDYDSHRYLECYFAIPMLGAILHTINIRLSPEQILYTIDHAEDDVINSIMTSGKCPKCRGTGVAQRKGDQCPVCNGSGGVIPDMREIQRSSSDERYKQFVKLADNMQVERSEWINVFMRQIQREGAA
jgi:acyl-coenzyme A synthetase/AMP-(fatty) acid ligase